MIASWSYSKKEFLPSFFKIVNILLLAFNEFDFGKEGTENLKDIDFEILAI